MRYPSSFFLVASVLAPVFTVLLAVVWSMGGRDWPLGHWGGLLALCLLLLVGAAASLGCAWDRGSRRVAARLRPRAAEEAASHPPPLPLVTPAALLAVEQEGRRVVDALRQKLAQAEERAQKFETLFERMVEAVLVIDGDRRIRAANPAAVALLGRRERQEVEGRTVLETVRNAPLQQFILHVLAENDQLKVAETEIVLHGSEAERVVQVHGVRLPGEGGAILVCTDISRLKRLENLRQEFVANVSHELKTPVTAIAGFLETLLDGALREPEQARRFVAIALDNARRLGAIIDDLLLLSRIEQEGGRERVGLTRQALRPLVERAVDLCRPLASDRGVPVAWVCEAGLEAAVNGPLLEQALVNLLTNAVTYSDPGKTVRLRAGRSPTGEVWLSVEDEGMGIEPAHLPRLFERFYRTDKARSRRRGGTGLGLAIVKHIVVAHGGQVTVRSTPGRGSVFTICLPGTDGAVLREDSD